MTGLVAAFARLHDSDPARPLVHLAASGQTLTCDDIWRTHRGFADTLRENGLKAGQLVLTMTGNRAGLLPLILAVRAVDAALLPVDAGTPAAEVDDLARRFGAAAIVVPAGAAASLDGTHASLGDGLDIVWRNRVTHRYEGTAVLKLTSGSTGTPRAARTNDDQLLEDSRHIVAAMGIGPDDTQIAVIPLSHAYGFSVIVVPLILQGTAIVLRESFVPHQLPADARAFGARTFPGVPFMFDYFIANPPADGWPEDLKRLISAGARLQPETVRGFHERFGIKVHSFYGASEAGGISYDADDAVSGTNSVGWPLPGVTITFRPDDRTPPGTGRVHIASTGVASGYVGDPSEEFCDGGFLTGDYGRFDDEGRLLLTGRVSSFINVAGKKVQPAEVEDVLRQMPGVTDVRVIGAADAQRGEQVVACLAVERGLADTISTLSVRRFCSSRLATFKIPRTVIVLDAIPLTARGKTDRRALEERVRATIEGIPETLC